LVSAGAATGADRRAGRVVGRMRAYGVRLRARSSRVSNIHCSQNVAISASAWIPGAHAFDYGRQEVSLDRLLDSEVRHGPFPGEAWCSLVSERFGRFDDANELPSFRSQNAWSVSGLIVGLQLLWFANGSRTERPSSS
jgi:hypothetical protein